MLLLVTSYGQYYLMFAMYLTYASSENVFLTQLSTDASVLFSILLKTNSPTPYMMTAMMTKNMQEYDENLNGVEVITEALSKEKITMSMDSIATMTSLTISATISLVLVTDEVWKHWE